jgi:hypothetical protein
MSHRQQPSISYVTRASSKPWSDVVALGDRIVRDLGLDESTDTLGRWMAHRVAELIDTARKTRSVSTRNRAQASATDLVLRLWEHRSHWPLGWPPESAMKVLSALNSEPNRGEAHPSGSGWLDSLRRLDNLHARERRIWFDMALFDLDLVVEERALDEGSADLRDEERVMLDGLLRQREWAARELFNEAVPDTPEGRAEIASRKLAELTLEREELISQAGRAAEEG